MRFDRALQNSLAKWLGDDVTFADGWLTRNTGRWRGRIINAPVGALTHHTAGGSSTAPNGNPGVVQYVIHPSSAVPYANAVVDSTGHVTICAAYPVWHAGLGDFAGTRWARLGVARNAGNHYLWGTEVVSAGVKADFSPAQVRALARLHCALREAARWPRFTYRLANHKDWAPKRKVDSRYPWQWIVTNAEAEWA